MDLQRRPRAHRGPGRRQPGAAGQRPRQRLRRHPEPDRAAPAGCPPHLLHARAPGPRHGRQRRRALRRQARLHLGREHDHDRRRVDDRHRDLHRPGRRRPRRAAGLPGHREPHRPLRLPGGRHRHHPRGRRDRWPLGPDPRPLVRPRRRRQPDGHPGEPRPRHRRRGRPHLRRRAQPRRDRGAAGLPGPAGPDRDVLRHRPEHHRARRGRDPPADRRRGPHPVQPLDELRRHGRLHPGAGRGGPQGQPGDHPHGARRPRRPRCPTSAPPTAAGASRPRSPSRSACSRSGSATSSSTGTATTCPCRP